MANSLGLDDDWDGVELVQNLEKAFDITIQNEEAIRTCTVGDMYDLLLGKIPANETDRKCASAMAFYRLRRGIRKLGFGDKLTPSTNLRFLDKRPKAAFKALEQETGLRLPRLGFTRGGFLSCFAMSILVSVTVGLSGISHGHFFTAAIRTFLFSVPLSAMPFSYFAPRKLPKNCSTLAGLAKKTALLNYGRLIKMGASHRDEDVWDNLLELLSEYPLPKAEITRETYLLASQLKKAAA